MWMYKQLFTSLPLADMNFFYDILPLIRVKLQQPYQIWHFIQHVFSHNSTTMQTAWMSLSSLSALVNTCVNDTLF